jgi:hypothetical protein
MTSWVFLFCRTASRRWRRHPTPHRFAVPTRPRPSLQHVDSAPSVYGRRTTPRQQRRPFTPWFLPRPSRDAGPHNQGHVQHPLQFWASLPARRALWVRKQSPANYRQCSIIASQRVSVRWLLAKADIGSQELERVNGRRITPDKCLEPPTTSSTSRRTRSSKGHATRNDPPTSFSRSASPLT